MQEEPIDQKLRQMAEHRGFKLVRSRRRKPGTGDYGKFGLTDADGKALLGQGESGLTASADDIEAYLREGAMGTWAASAMSVPTRTMRDKPRKSGGEGKDALSIQPRHPSPAALKGPTARAAPQRRKGAHNDTEKSQVDPDRRQPSRRQSKVRACDLARTEPKAHAVPDPAPSCAPVPELTIRMAKAGDGAALALLLQQLAHVEIDEMGIARNLEATRRAKGGMMVAELGKIVGCCGWALISTVQYGVMGRVTMILVDSDNRRHGIATALLGAASRAMKKAGCTRLEAMSDIEISNAHNFFRSLKFEQTSYRFARALDAQN